MSLRAFGRSVGKRVGRMAGRLQETSPLAADVLESDDAYLVLFDAPGAESSDIQVRYEDDSVEVRVDRFRPFREGFEMVVPGRGLALDGAARLPDDAVVAAEAATATLHDDGTLAVELPKADGGEAPHGSTSPPSTDDASDLDESDD